MSYRRVREENIKPEYLRLKQAMIVFNMGRTRKRSWRVSVGHITRSIGWF